MLVGHQASGAEVRIERAGGGRSPTDARGADAGGANQRHRHDDDATNERHTLVAPSNAAPADAVTSRAW